MKRSLYLIGLSIIALSLTGAGCVSSSNPLPASTTKTPLDRDDEIKQINWCNETNRSQSDQGEVVWISSENFNGSQHAPSIRHICKNNKELFRLQMDWDDFATLHRGQLIAASSSGTRAISSSYIDPDLKIMMPDTSKPDQLRFSIDGQIHTFDERHNQFIN